MIKNPYWGKDFFDFFSLFFQRLINGEIVTRGLTSDEIQIFALSLGGIGAALVGSFLIFRKMAMLANALSHVVLLGIVIAYLLVTPFSTVKFYEFNFEVLMLAALVTGILTTFVTQFVHAQLKLQADASVGLIFTTFFALGILLVTIFTRNAHIGIEVIMGNVDALHFQDLKTVFWIVFFDLFFICIFFKEFQLIAFDEGFAKSVGVSVQFFHYLLMMLVSLTVIGMFRAMGALLVLSFLVGLPLIARFFTDKVSHLLWIAAGFALLSSFLGVALSRHILSVHHIAISTSGLVVTLIGLFFLASLCFSPKQGLIVLALKRRHWKNLKTK